MFATFLFPELCVCVSVLGKVHLISGQINSLLNHGNIGRFWWRANCIEMGSEESGNPNNVGGKDVGATCFASYNIGEHKRAQQEEKR